MKYVCLVYAVEEELHSLPDSPPDAECMSYVGSLLQRGKFLAGEALASSETATTLEVRGGKLSVTDGPFAETREQLLGFYLIDAENLDEAIKLAAGIPPARVGKIEVRPVRPLELDPRSDDSALAGIIMPDATAD